MGVLLSLLDHISKTRAERWHVAYGPEIAKSRPPRPCVIPGLAIAPGPVTVFGGAGFGGKTMALQSMLLSVAAGLPVWGHFECKQGAVMHLDFEQGPDLTFLRYQRMAREMGINLEALGEAFACTSLPERALDDKPESRDELVWLLTGRTLAIVDAFRGAFPDAQENDSSVRKYLDMLTKVSELTGCTIIVIAHSRKMGDDKDVRSSLRGSGALFDAAQAVYMLEGAKGKPTQVHNTKERVTGGLREVFGLFIEDTEGVHEDRNERDARWGLRVRYGSPADVTAAYMKEDGNDDQRMYFNIERMATLGERIIHLVASNSGMSAASIITALQNIESGASIRGVLSTLTSKGDLYTEGKGANAIYYVAEPSTGVYERLPD